MSLFSCTVASIVKHNWLTVSTDNGSCSVNLYICLSIPGDDKGTLPPTTL